MKVNDLLQVIDAEQFIYIGVGDACRYCGIAMGFNNEVIGRLEVAKVELPKGELSALRIYTTR